MCRSLFVDVYVSQFYSRGPVLCARQERRALFRR